MNLKSIYTRLLRQHGQQRWWPGDSAFEIMVGAILTQNTAWSNVEKAIANLKQHRLLSAAAVLDTPIETVAEIIRPSGYFNIKAQRLRAFCIWYLKHGGTERLRYWHTTRLRKALLSVKGIGRETADDMLLYAFNRCVFVIDAYTRRMFSRLGVITGDEDYDELRMFFERALPRDVMQYAEYHALIVNHGKDICRPHPHCAHCTFESICPSALT